MLMHIFEYMNAIREHFYVFLWKVSLSDASAAAAAAKHERFECIVRHRVWTFEEEKLLKVS